ncbi:spermidine/putrescine ABC transporter ATP-binding subunit [Rhodoligotrophos appendicifer]|uniref:ABC transporter ATP-binding protein n=1 Tax=Rhodoligotrophos appendicifer TaxID=987056 RepID=UPI0014795E68|nr:ABC transporter ATP-binding protein [Rhodoligotrophos appendicifer]
MLTQQAASHSEPGVAPGTPRLEVTGLVRQYTKDVAVGPLSFSIMDGEFLSFLGPSGCGKTTALRCIAGFETVDAGSIVLGGRRIERVPPHKRGVGLVFQTPALFPHLTVAENVAFGLELQRVAKLEIKRRTKAALDLVGLTSFGDRMPNQLSGGQQQRIALARSLIMEPPLLLLDEPLSALDLKLRVQMREELRSLQRRLKKTTLFVTHDQTEALALSDRIAVLSQGRIEQVGTPEEIYLKPASRFVAEFIGASNLIEARVTGFADGMAELTTRTGLIVQAAAPVAPARESVTLLIRPERIKLAPRTASEPRQENLFPAEVRDLTYLGEDIQLRVLIGGNESLLVVRKSGDEFSPLLGQSINVSIEPANVYLLAS